jgi:hypothetical protein
LNIQTIITSYIDKHQVLKCFILQIWQIVYCTHKH